MAAPAAPAPAASVSAGREIMLEFIEKYKNSECLWKITDKNYKIKQYRLKASEELLQILRKIDSTANIDSVTKKINSLRSAYNKEHNKVKAASRSGNGGEDEYIPKLWYYDSLSFLNEKETEVERSYDINAILSEENDENKDQNTNMDMQLSPRSESTQRWDNKNTKRNEKNSVCDVLTKISKRLDSTNTKPTYSAFGEHVAEKLRNMTIDSAKYCQKIMSDAIFYAEFNNLNHTSRIVTDPVNSERSWSPSAQSQSSYFERPYQPPSTFNSSQHFRSSQTPSAPYMSPKEQFDRPNEPPSTQQLDKPSRSPPESAQSIYQSPCLLEKPCRPRSTPTQSHHQPHKQEINRPYLRPSIHVQSLYQTRSPATQTKFSRSILLPYQPPEPLQQTSASNAIIAESADEVLDYSDRSDDNSSTIVAEDDFNTMKNFLIFKPRYN